MMPPVSFAFDEMIFDAIQRGRPLMTDADARQASPSFSSLVSAERAWKPASGRQADSPESCLFGARRATRAFHICLR